MQHTCIEVGLGLGSRGLHKLGVELAAALLHDFHHGSTTGADKG
jgi:hypothetical protein